MMSVDKDTLIEKAVQQQDRLDSVIQFFMTLDESLPGRWSYSTAYSRPIIYCNVKDMDDWKVVKSYFGKRLIRHRPEPLIVQHSYGAEKVWYFDSVRKSRLDDRYPAWELTLSIDPRMEGSSCRLVEVDRKEIVVWDVECGNDSSSSLPST